MIWADAICINQITSSTNAEKGEQIQLTPDIYRIVACVQVYLGDDSDDVPGALELLYSIADYSEHLDDSQHAEGEIGMVLAMQSGSALPLASDRRWEALRAFFRRPWFHRVWVIQEFVYAADDHVLCGDVEVGYGNNLPGFARVSGHREAYEGARPLFLITDPRLRAMGYMSGPYMVYNIGEDEPSNVSGLSIRKDLNAIKNFEAVIRPAWFMDRAEGKAFPNGKPIC
ncbi:hypothetical protein QQS21_010218 [Conoideocrella luteorostrata]|uniref:Heterokaryon incompatibility domain-containing protein n=1 Tax=Conoideocrella luteorostrata TaxID=1105319 RepID=A0AAJ0CGE6_9HYPO|nr:hypothetical protein QQS21_010218 [Conoideocrella luteorostrata]